MCDRITYHVSLELDPRVRFHGFVFLLHADADYGTLYAIRMEHSLQRDGAYEARWSKNAVCRGAPHRIAQRVRAGARSSTQCPSGHSVATRVCATREVTRGSLPDDSLRRNEGELRTPELTPIAGA